MKTKEEFKSFVNKNPSFAIYVNEGKTSWQKLFELYTLYDEDSTVWNEYKKDKPKDASSSLSFSSIINSLKGINLDNFQNNLTSIQKAVSLLEEFTRKDDKKTNKEKPKSKDIENIEKFYSD